MDDFVTEFNEKMAAKSREVCERIEREDAERRSGLSEVERRILAMWPRFEDGEPVKRPAPKVLDADGVEIKVGDVVWDDDGVEMTVTGLVGELPGHVTAHGDNPPATYSISPKHLTHTRPDSWERLEEDASKEPCFYFGFEDKPCDDGAGCPANKLGNCSELKASDIIRRAKALAGVEAARDED